uniref:Uncharacterized protein n=1 Tax=Cannabis sativa TaxID=3483 RepID=A0A803P5U4_CANSA
MGDDDDKFKVCIKCNRDTQWKRKIALSDLCVRDELAFPLKVKLREEAGFSSLPCLIELHPDLKMKILEFLPDKNAMLHMRCSSSS